MNQSIIKRILEAIKAFGRLIAKAFIWLKNKLIGFKNKIKSETSGDNEEKLRKGFEILNTKHIQFEFNNFVSVDNILAYFKTECVDRAIHDTVEDLDAIDQSYRDNDNEEHSYSNSMYMLKNRNNLNSLESRMIKYLGLYATFISKSNMNIEETFDGYRLKDSTKFIKDLARFKQYPLVSERTIGQRATYTLNIVRDTENLLNIVAGGTKYRMYTPSEVMNKFINKLNTLLDKELKEAMNKELKGIKAKLYEEVISDCRDLINTYLTLSNKLLNIYNAWSANATVKLSNKLLELAAQAYKNPKSIEDGAIFKIEVPVPFIDGDNVNESSLFDFDFYTAGNIFQEVAFI